MSDIKFIMAQVFQADLLGSDLLCAGADNKQAVSAEQIVQGEEWFVPFIQGGLFDRYQRVIAADSPDPDAIQTVRLYNPWTGATQWVLGTQEDWVEAVNGCCGTTPEMPDVAIVDPILIEFPCAEIICIPGAPVYTYQDVFPALATGERYLLSGSANGEAFEPAADPAGYATMAAALTAAQTLWGAYGTWTATDTDGLTLKTETGTNGQVKISVLPAP